MFNSDNFRVGAMAELKAQLYYMEEGYEIFTPQMTQSRCDFIAVQGRTCIKVQVKKATDNPTKWGTYLQVRIQGRAGFGGKCREYTEEDFDELFIVHDLGQWRVPANLVLDKKSVTFGKITQEGVVSGPKASFNSQDYKVK